MKMFVSVFLAFCLFGFAASSQLNEFQAAGKDVSSKQDFAADDPCTCSKEPVPQCGCCAEFEFAEKEHKLCMNMTCVKAVKGIRFTATYDGEVLFNKTLSATNPPPFCQGVCPISCICEKYYNMSYGDDNKWGGCLDIYGDLLVPVLNITLGCVYLPVDEEMTIDETIPSLFNYMNWTKDGIFNGIQQWFQNKLNKMNEWRSKSKNPLDFLFENRVEDEKENIEVPDIE